MTENDFPLSQAIAYFEEAEELSRESRDEAEKSRDYYDHKQWTSGERSALQKRRQPCITRNRIKPKVDFLKGLETQTRTEPKAFPRTPHEDGGADAATDAIRFVCDENRYAHIKSNCFENLTVEGVCGVEVFAKKSRDGVKVCISRYAWDRIFYDPHSRENDFEDTLYRGGVVWMDYEQAKRRYPEHTEALTNTLAKESELSTTYGDTPRLRWADAKRKRVRIVKLEFKHNDEVWCCEFTRGGFLTQPEASPYLDENGVPEWSILLQSAHCDRDGNRYGWVKAWIDLQDEINKRASKHLHLVSVRQTYSSKGAGGDPNRLKAELAKPDGHLLFESGEWGKDFGIVPTMDQAKEQFMLLQEAKAEIDSVGVNAALSGAEGRDLSGKAIGRLQAGGSTEIKPLLDALAQFNNRVYRVIWNRIKQFWTAEKWIRVTDDENNLKWVGLNQPVTLGQQLQEEYGELPPQYASDPRMNQVVEVKNEVAKIDVDIVIEEVPDVVNVQQEQFEAITQIIPSLPDEMKPAALELLVASSPIRNKQKFLDKLKGNVEDPQQQAAIQQQQQQAAEIHELTLDKLASEIERNRAAGVKDLAAAEAVVNPLPDITAMDKPQPQIHPEEQAATIQAIQAKAMRDHGAALKDAATAHSILNPQAQPEQPQTGSAEEQQGMLNGTVRMMAEGGYKSPNETAMVSEFGQPETVLTRAGATVTSQPTLLPQGMEAQVIPHFEEGKIRQILMDNMDKDFVRRIAEPNSLRQTLDLGNGDYATHKMSYVTDDNGAYVYPNVVFNPQTGKLQELSGRDAITHAFKNKEYIKMSPDEAAWFTTNYKKIWPMQ